MQEPANKKQYQNYDHYAQGIYTKHVKRFHHGVKLFAREFARCFVPTPSGAVLATDGSVWGEIVSEHEFGSGSFAPLAVCCCGFGHYFCRSLCSPS